MLRVTFNSKTRAPRTEEEIKSMSLFDKKYVAAELVKPFAEERHNTQMILCAIHDTIIENLKAINKPASPKNPFGTPGGDMMNLGYRGVFDQSRAIWLFYGTPHEDIVDSLADFIIDKHDQYMIPGDYTLLFYLSLQEQETQDSLSALPISMLYDIYEPLIEAGKEERRNREVIL
jgi:hypothetical protein